MSDYVIVNGKRYTLEDMRDWFIQIRGFPSILVFGKGKNQIAGEGQYGGRTVSDVVHKVENTFIEKLGIPEYQRKLDLLMAKPSKQKLQVKRLGMLDVTNETKVWGMS